MSDLFRLAGAVRDDPLVRAWFEGGDTELRRFVRPWFECMRVCGDDVREQLHDGNPTACVDDVAFAYVAAYTAHAAVGFFHGVSLPDPARLLTGTGKRMRHVKLRRGKPVDAPAVTALIEAAYRDLRDRIG